VKRRLAAITLIMFTSFYGCSALRGQDARQVEFSEMFPFEMNESLRLTIPQELRGPHPTRSVRLLLENLSQDSIWIPTEPRAQLFVYSDEASDWIGITDLVVHLADQPLLLYPQGSPFSADVLTVLPELGGGVSVQVRVVVVGYIFSDNAPTDTRVGAYIDISYPQ